MLTERDAWGAYLAARLAWRLLKVFLGWFAAVRNIRKPAIAAALQVMLLTGARPGEVLALRWEDVNTKWKGLAIRDKVEGERVIPLTPYGWQLLATLPRLHHEKIEAWILE